MTTERKDEAERIEVLPGAPWDSAYIASILEEGKADVVLANGYEYTMQGITKTERARVALVGEDDKPRVAWR